MLRGAPLPAEIASPLIARALAENSKTTTWATSSASTMC
jgi:hypothetical protein